MGRLGLVGFLDHAEQGGFAGLPIEGPGGIENLVPAVLGIGLRKHHQLDIAGVALEPGEGFQQVVDFVLSKGQAQFAVGLNQCVAPLGQSRQCVAGAWAAASRKNAAAEGSVTNTDSVIRSCSKASMACKEATGTSLWPPKKPFLAISRYSTKRSSRSTSLRPQLRAMSLAFDDHGETVPDARRHVNRRAGLQFMGLFGLQQRRQTATQKARTAVFAEFRNQQSPEMKARIQSHDGGFNRLNPGSAASACGTATRPAARANEEPERRSPQRHRSHRLVNLEGEWGAVMRGSWQRTGLGSPYFNPPPDQARRSPLHRGFR